MEDARVIFDRITDDYPGMAAHPAQDADIVKRRPFEMGIIKVIRNEENKLTSYEKGHLHKLKLVPAAAPNNQQDVNETTNWCHDAIQLNKRHRGNEPSNYINPSFF